MAPLLCKDCEHYRGWWSGRRCKRPVLNNYVSGGKILGDFDAQRERHRATPLAGLEACGPTARFFKAKRVPKSLPPISLCALCDGMEDRL